MLNFESRFQLIKNNYGISLPQKCESRLHDARPLTKEHIESAMRQLRNGNDFKQGQARGQQRIFEKRVENSIEFSRDRQSADLMNLQMKTVFRSKPTPWNSCII